MEGIISGIFFIIILFLLMGVPILLTILNTVFLTRTQSIKIKQLVVQEKIVNIVTMVLGTSYSFILWGVLNAKDYNSSIVKNMDTFQYHTPISLVHMPTFLLFALGGIVGYLVLLLQKKARPPLVSLLCVSLMYMGMTLCIVFLVQLSKHILPGEKGFEIETLYLGLFPVNYMLCAIKQIRSTVKREVEKWKNNDTKYNHKILNLCKEILSNSLGWLLMAYVLILPLIGVALMIMLVFGQRPDAIVKMFTETSDWMLSQKISPPPVEYNDHYLCTVALRGHKKIVRPTRCGIRRGVKIVVNRQLCVANAFEEWIQEKSPRMHKAIRSFYDQKGYPLSEKIQTPWQADMVYMCMKPLEYFFLLCLYLFDTNPENRIAMQYVRN